MTAATVRTQPSGVADGLEVPRPLRLLLTVGWSLGESVGLPVAAYTVAAWPGGRDASLTAGLVAIWLTAGIRKAATGSAPSLLTISAAVLTLQTTVVLATGELWLFLLQFPLPNQCMRVVSARTAAGSNPLVARLAADVAALRQPDITPACTASPRGATWPWAAIFLPPTAAPAALIFTEPARVFPMPSTAATVALAIAGTGASTLWLLPVLRQPGLRLRFAPA